MRHKQNAKKYPISPFMTKILVLFLLGLSAFLAQELIVYFHKKLNRSHVVGEQTGVTQQLDDNQNLVLPLYAVSKNQNNHSDSVKVGVINNQLFEIQSSIHTPIQKFTPGTNPNTKLKKGGYQHTDNTPHDNTPNLVLNGVSISGNSAYINNVRYVVGEKNPSQNRTELALLLTNISSDSSAISATVIFRGHTHVLTLSTQKEGA